MARKIKTVRIQHPSPYREGAHYLVFPTDLTGDFSVCKGLVHSLEENGAWLTLRPGSAPFPGAEEVWLVDFQADSVINHRSRILRREHGRVWVDAPSLTRQEKNQMLPLEGRRDFRVPANLPVVILLKDEGLASSLPRGGHLNDLSRGGMGVVVPIGDIYAKGQLIEVQVVSWAYGVSVETSVERVRVEGDHKLLALKFPEDLSPEQRERVSSFILQVQRKASLESTLPVPVEEAASPEA